MTLRSCRAVCLPLVCGVVMLTSCKEETADLRFVPENNQQYELAYQEDVSGELKGNKQTHTLGSSFILKTNQDSALNINATYKRFWLNIRSVTDSLSVDTDHPVTFKEDDPGTFVPAIWQGVKGLSFSYRMNNLGKLETVGSFTPLLHEITKKILPDSAAAANSAKFSQVWDIAAGQFSPAAATAMLTPVFPEYPGTVLKAGDTLNRVYRTSGAIPLTILQVFKISEIKGDQVTLILGGSGFTDDTPSTTLKAGQAGTFKVNRQTGMMESAYIEEVIEGKMENEPYRKSTVIRASSRKL